MIFVFVVPDCLIVTVWGRIVGNVVLGMPFGRQYWWIVSVVFGVVTPPVPRYASVAQTVFVVGFQMRQLVLSASISVVSLVFLSCVPCAVVPFASVVLHEVGCALGFW